MSQPLLSQFKAKHTGPASVTVAVNLTALNPCCEYSVQELDDSTPDNRHVVLTIGDDVNKGRSTATATLGFTLNNAANAHNVRVTVRRPYCNDVDYDVPVR